MTSLSATPDTAPATAPQTQTEPAPRRSIPSTPNRLDRQIRVEVRKAIDTRSGTALVITTAVLATVVIAALIGLSRLDGGPALSFDTLATAAGGATSMLLPVIGIMLVTSEWSQRTVLTTFTLEPRRLRVLGTKIIAGLLIALASGAAALIVAAAAMPVIGMVSGTSATWTFSAASFAGFLAVQAIGVCSGIALAALILNTPAAIVAYVGYALVLPSVMPMLQFWHAARTIYPWIDFSAAQQKLMDVSMASSDWAHLAVSGSIWLVVPLVAGAIRILRSEIS